MMDKFILLILFLVISCHTYGQDDNITYKDGNYLFQSKYDDSTYIAELVISKNNNKIFAKTYDYDKIISINGYDLDGDGKKEYLIDFYTGGAHCCTIMWIGEIRNDKFRFTDSLFWGNSGYEVKDIDKDGELEIKGYNDMFAYAFTNYAQSYSSIAIYKYNNGRLHDVNSDFEGEVENNVKELKEVLNEYTSKGFDCPRTDSEDTFNTDAGAVKAILAPITGDYASIGRASEGYKLINAVYKCPDKDKFIKILKNEYKLK
jgi:hypothetical protein